MLPLVNFGMHLCLYFYEEWRIFLYMDVKLSDQRRFLTIVKQELSRMMHLCECMCVCACAYMCLCARVCIYLKGGRDRNGYVRYCYIKENHHYHTHPLMAHTARWTNRWVTSALFCLWKTKDAQFNKQMNNCSLDIIPLQVIVEVVFILRCLFLFV